MMFRFVYFMMVSRMAFVMTDLTRGVQENTSQFNYAVLDGFAYNMSDEMVGISSFGSEDECEIYCQVQSEFAAYMTYTLRITGEWNCFCFSTKPKGVPIELKGSISRPLKKSGLCFLESEPMIKSFQTDNSEQCRVDCYKVTDGKGSYSYQVMDQMSKLVMNNKSDSKEHDKTTNIIETIDTKQNCHCFIDWALKLEAYDESCESGPVTIPIIKYSNSDIEYGEELGVFYHDTVAIAEAIGSQLPESFSGCDSWCRRYAPQSTFVSWLETTQYAPARCRCFANHPQNGLITYRGISSPRTAVGVAYPINSSMDFVTKANNPIECHNHCKNHAQENGKKQAIFTFSEYYSSDHPNCGCMWKLPKLGIRILDKSSITGMACVLPSDPSIYTACYEWPNSVKPLIDAMDKQGPCIESSMHSIILLDIPTLSIMVNDEEECQNSCRSTGLPIVYTIFDQTKTPPCSCWGQRPLVALQSTEFKTHLVAGPIYMTGLYISDEQSVIHKTTTNDSTQCQIFCHSKSNGFPLYFSFSPKVDYENCSCHPTLTPHAQIYMAGPAAACGPTIPCLSNTQSIQDIIQDMQINENQVEDYVENTESFIELVPLDDDTSRDSPNILNIHLDDSNKPHIRGIDNYTLNNEPVNQNTNHLIGGLADMQNDFNWTHDKSTPLVQTENQSILVDTFDAPPSIENDQMNSPIQNLPLGKYAADNYQSITDIQQHHLSPNTIPDKPLDTHFPNKNVTTQDTIPVKNNGQIFDPSKSPKPDQNHEIEMNHYSENIDHLQTETHENDTSSSVIRTDKSDSKIKQIDGIETAAHTIKDTYHAEGYIYGHNTEEKLDSPVTDKDPQDDEPINESDQFNESFNHPDETNKENRSIKTNIVENNNQHDLRPINEKDPQETEYQQLAYKQTQQTNDYSGHVSSTINVDNQISITDQDYSPHIKRNNTMLEHKTELDPTTREEMHRTVQIPPIRHTEQNMDHIPLMGMANLQHESLTEHEIDAQEVKTDLIIASELVQESDPAEEHDTVEEYDKVQGTEQEDTNKGSALKYQTHSETNQEYNPNDRLAFGKMRDLHINMSIKEYPSEYPSEYHDNQSQIIADNNALHKEHQSNNQITNNYNSANVDQPDSIRKLSVGVGNKFDTQLANKQNIKMHMEYKTQNNSQGKHLANNTQHLDNQENNSLEQEEEKETNDTRSAFAESPQETDWDQNEDIVKDQYGTSNSWEPSDEGDDDEYNQILLSPELQNLIVEKDDGFAEIILTSKFLPGAEGFDEE